MKWNGQGNEGGARPDLLRRVNRDRVLVAIRGEGPLTRAEVARQTGISYPTVLKVIGDLIGEGLLEEGERVQPAIGRPGVAVQMARVSSKVISVVVGVEGCAVAEANLDGEIATEREIVFETPDCYEAFLELLGKAVRMLSGGGEARCLGVGMSVPGVIDPGGETIVVCPNLEWLNGKALGRDVEKVSGLPAILVRAMQAHYLADASYGAGREVADFVVVNFAGGIGMGVCSGGRFLEGSGGITGELGHLTVETSGGRLCGCGNHGCLETVASDRAIIEAVREREGLSLTMEEVIAKVAEGSLDIGENLERAVDYFAIGLAAVVNLFNPRRIILYGHFLEVREDLFERLVAETNRRALGPSGGQVEILAPRRDPHKRQQIGAAAALIDALARGWSKKEAMAAAG